MEREALRGSWSRRLVIGVLAAFVLANAWWLRGPILWALACPLVADDRPGPGCYLWLRSDDGIHLDAPESCALAARLLGDVPSGKILLVDAQPCRLARFGILLPFAAATKRTLVTHGVPAAAIEILPGGDRGLGAELLVVSRFLAAHAQAEVQLLSPRLNGAAHRRTIARLLPPEQAARLSVRGVLNRHYNETNWWQSRSGMRDFMLGWLQRVYGGIRTGDAGCPPDWDTDAYERSLVQTAVRDQS
jgi:hypothetical protein